jgi:hypothetical protein
MTDFVIPPRHPPRRVQPRLVSTTADELLGGAQRVRTARRGFAPWSPQRATRALLAQVLAVLDEYADYLPLTLRQIFYRLVGAYGYEKDEKAYGRLGEHLNKARRAGLVSWDAIRDDSCIISRPDAWESADQFVFTIREQAAELQLDRTAGQRVKLFVWCEAAGMVPQLDQLTHSFGIEVRSNGGFDSSTSRHNFAVEIANGGRSVEVLHIGDHDQSGAHDFLALKEDVQAFVRTLAPGLEVVFTRLAVLPAQIERYNLPTALPKPTDKRAWPPGERTAQAEALPPDVLAGILREAIEQRLNRAAYDAVLRQEQIERERLLRRLAE